jgi:biopolymer transport protein ExbB/TolQ
MFDWTSLGRGLGPVAIGVVVVLVAMSIMSLAIAGERYWTYRRAIQQSRRYLVRFSRLLLAGEIKEAIDLSENEDYRQAHLAQVLGAGLKEWLAFTSTDKGRCDPDAVIGAVREAIHQTAALHLADLRRGLSALATIGSTAPFVGLFGTTFGIINAFIAISVTGAGGLSAISAGISEALVTTALGLFVAVPAIWAYNYFISRIERIS